MWVGSNGRSSLASPRNDTPAARPISANGSPWGVGNSATRRVSTTWPSDALAVSSSGVAADTVISSTVPPTLIVSSSARRSPTRSSMPSRTSFLKPESVTVIEYMPEIRNGAWKKPTSLVTNVELVPMATLVTVTVAPGTMDLLWSRTTPVMVPRASCARTGTGRTPARLRARAPTSATVRHCDRTGREGDATGVAPRTSRASETSPNQSLLMSPPEHRARVGPRGSRRARAACGKATTAQRPEFTTRR